MPTDIFCETDHQTTIIYRHYVLPILGITQMVTLLPGYVKFIIAHIRKRLKISHCVFLTTLFFFTLCFATYTILIHGLLTSCIVPADARDGFAYTLSAICNATVQLGVVGIMYSRLAQIFEDTEMALSKCLSRFLWITYAITVAMLWSAAVLYTQSPELSTSVVVLAGLLLIFLVSLVDSLFIYKLCKVYKTHAGHKSAKILQVITKNAILALVSTSLTFVSFVAAVMDTSVGTIHSHSWFAITIFWDIYTNFACVLLTFTFFESYYGFVCGPLHTKCNNEMEKKIPTEQSHDGVETHSVGSSSPRSAPDSASHAMQLSGTAPTASQASGQTVTMTDLSVPEQSI
mmetsp:Transcript_63211/g.100502  ORF Transcript_63211/g.100502 Transcript_63211/m.100502 type:complete len:345 (+) Transcript_63211:69-1103(+)